MPESYNCEIKFSQFKREITGCSNELVKTGKQYINQADTTMVTDEINMVVVKVNDIINESIRLLLKKINMLY